MKRAAIALSVIAGAVIFVGPFVHYLIKGEFPKGFPLRAKGERTAARDKERPASVETTSDVGVGTPARINGFLPYYYERENPPDLARLREWGANAVTIYVEDLEAFREEAELLNRNGLKVSLPAGDPPSAPPGLDLVKEVEGLIAKAHGLGLAVKLSVPPVEKWLKIAEKSKVEMLGVCDEVDAFMPYSLSPEQIGRRMEILLKEARKHYSGQVGVGFTELVDRGTFAAVPHAGGYNAAGYDFLTINPHPDPSMTPDRLSEYVAASAQSARGIAERAGIKKVYIGALMVRAKSEKIKGFTEAHGHAYSDAEETEFYARLFDKTGDLLDGYFLQFSGWERRPAADTVRRYYGKGR